jgi:hypothetical protein
MAVMIVMVTVFRVDLQDGTICVHVHAASQPRRPLPTMVIGILLK